MRPRLQSAPFFRTAPRHFAPRPFVSGGRRLTTPTGQIDVLPIRGSQPLSRIIGNPAQCYAIFEKKCGNTPLCRKVPSKLIVFQPIFLKMSELAGCG